MQKRPAWSEEWHRAHPHRVQEFAGRRRAAFWRQQGFRNLVIARNNRPTRCWNEDAELLQDWLPKRLLWDKEP